MSGAQSACAWLDTLAQNARRSAKQRRRKKWANCWEAVVYCSERCRREGRQQEGSGSGAAAAIDAPHAARLRE